MGYSGAGGKLIDEKNQQQKSRDTVPLNSVEQQICGLDGSLFKPREIRNWSKDDAL